MIAYLNELSLPNVHSEVEAIQGLETFGFCYQGARACGVKEIKILISFFDWQFSPQYTFLNWIEDTRADQDLRTLLKSLFGTLPYIDEILTQYQLQNNKPIEVVYENKQCIGLGLASERLFNTISISFESSNWSLPNYNVIINSIIENDLGEIEEIRESASVKNISQIKNVDIHREFIQYKVISLIENGKEIWSKRKELFPNLDFCVSTKVQIESLNFQDLQFNQILARLIDLQNVAAKLNGRSIKPEDFPTKTSPEFTSRENQYKNQLLVTCPDGERRLFTWHSRFTPGAGRIHFFPLEAQNIILIGYIGTKIS